MEVDKRVFGAVKQRLWKGRIEGHRKSRWKAAMSGSPSETVWARVRLVGFRRKRRSALDVRSVGKGNEKSKKIGWG